MAREFIAKANTKFTLVNSPSAEELEKLAPQCQVLVRALLEAQNHTLTRADWLVAVEGKLETRQKPEKIITYYQSKLVKAGFLNIEEPAVYETQEKGAVKKGKKANLNEPAPGEEELATA